eukprot:scaffold7092_cov262-Pinguiococcus_pyrenoidosus.AAC.24
MDTEARSSLGSEGSPEAFGALAAYPRRDQEHGSVFRRARTTQTLPDRREFGLSRDPCLVICRVHAWPYVYRGRPDLIFARVHPVCFIGKNALTSHCEEKTDIVS